MPQFSTAPAGLQLLKRTVYKASNTWTPDPRTKWIKVRLGGGGGAGGGVTAVAGHVGSGAGAGGIEEELIPVATFGTSQSVTIGAGGTGSSGANGGNGNTTSFGALLQATGGTGGLVGNTTASIAGSLGGVGSGGDLNQRGGSGHNSLYNATLNVGFSGKGADSPYGGGALARINTGMQAGNAADANSCAGGSGATAGAGGAAAGGNGGSGICEVEEYA